MNVSLTVFKGIECVYIQGVCVFSFKLCVSHSKGIFELECVINVLFMAMSGLGKCFRI